TTLGKGSWEQAESALQKIAVQLALKKGTLAARQIDLIFAGDLLNQCIGSTFGLRDFGIPLIGLYGACSIMALYLLNAALAVDGGAAERAVAVTSSHFCSAERQFRQPLDYGGQRPPTAQWTVTGAGACVLGRGEGIAVEAVTPGRVVDLGIKDANNMGAAMAPAAADTIRRFFSDTGTSPADYDRVYTGDLGAVGSRLLCELLDKEGVDLRPVHRDCGVMIYDAVRQDVHAGGSGCGCSASVLCAHVLPEMAAGRHKNVLFCATGALMSPTSSQQGESIPGIAHLVRLRA
ncbi:MAG: stage V sporulation protein AD, partial [Clostridia bacterium]|nr:stage V sporulation protein AD [Clostridia bacterium]